MRNSIYTLCLLGLLLPATSSAMDQSSPPDSLVVDTLGNVGVGTATPVAKLDVLGDVNVSFEGASDRSLQSLFVMRANNTNIDKRSDAGFVMENTRESFSWAFRTDEGNDEAFTASKQGTGGRELIVSNPSNTALGAQLLLGNGAKNVNGTWEDASSRSLKKNIHDLSNDDAMEAFRGLKTVKYQYKSDQNNTQMVGFIAEDVPELLATHSRKSLSSMKIVAVLTKALQIQDISLQQTKADIKAKDAKITDMEAKINKLMQMQERLAKTMENRLMPFSTVSYNTSIK